VWRRRNRIDRPLSGPTLVTELCSVLGIALLLMAPTSVVVLLALRIGEERPITAEFAGLSAAVLLIGVASGGLLLALAAGLRYVRGLAREAALRGVARAEVDQPITYVSQTPGVLDSGLGAAGSSDAGSAPPHEPEVLSLLREVRDLVVQDPSERPVVAERVRGNRQRLAARAVIDAINRRRLARARELLQDAEALLGTNPTFERLSHKLAEADARNEPLDYARTKRLVEEAIREGNTALAEEFAHALCADHPESPRCRRVWEDARRARLHAHVQQSADHHHWTEALAAAEEFLVRFPDTPEAESLRGQIATLRANAEIVQRRQYEERFKEHLRGRQFDEALRIARLVVEQFPSSPQAEALRPQVAALEQRLSAPRDAPVAP
jgi:hypothetical protein